MESTNLHHLHQDHSHPPQTSSSSSSLSAPSLFGLPTSHSWTPNVALNAGNLNPNFQESNPRSRAFAHKKDIGTYRLLNDSGLGYQWASAEEREVSSTQSDHDLGLQYSNIKEEISDVFPCKFTEMLNSTGSSMEHKDFNALSEKLLLKTLSSGDFYSTSENFANNFGGGMGMGVAPSRRSFSQIYPSINISNLNHSSPAISSSLDMNMQSSDLLNSARFNGGLSQHTQDGLARFDNVSFRLDHMHQHQIDRSSCNSSNIPSHFTNGMAETKRPNTTLVESKASQSQNVPKKSRLESRSSCPPFKVRKEKLGDRIAALQQLVAPFGKTDTASVLMEAIGYIKFLQSQVEVSGLCEAKEEQKMDLRSRGLCLVPLSCMSYLAADSAGGGVWQQPDFGGPTL
ncbi:transcription factor bHLH110 isoform X2 [Neltuma alba]|uniref:transcription factor bHLH110 isoform X2 n=1 Tax=Neltuma alba TaxID=207710 RepID=UPI0010A51E32|nr:transcription factor bHLH110 isoform X2 [Prosopis alba]